jgi:hypothetical protein
MSSVFISYSHKDKEFVRRLVSDLNLFGVNVLIDEQVLKIGDSLIEKLRATIDRTEYVVAVLSNHSIDSPWVRKELDIAMNQEIEGSKVKVLPLLISHVDLPGFLKGKVYADFRDEQDYPREFTKLCGSMGIDIKVQPKPDIVLATIYNKIGMTILGMEVDDASERFILEEIHRLYHLRDHTDAGASSSYDNSWKELLKRQESEIRDISARIKELKGLSIKEEMFRQAFEYFHKSSRLGDPEGMWNLGWRYYLGEGIERDLYQAVSWWDKAAKLGHIPAADMIKKV